MIDRCERVLIAEDDPSVRRTERGAEATKILDDGIAALLPKRFNLDALQALVKSSLAATAER